MRVLVDEDTAVQLVHPLRHVLPTHDVDHVAQIGWSGKGDRHVLADARKARYHVVITRDRSQLSDPDECDAIKRSGLHHIRYRQRREGTRGLALALGAVIAAMPIIMDELTETDGQRLIHIAALDPRNRYDSVDPRTEPPSKYWPR
jgi:hypothetical protein